MLSHARSKASQFFKFKADFEGKPVEQSSHPEYMQLIYKNIDDDKVQLALHSPSPQPETTPEIRCPMKNFRALVAGTLADREPESTAEYQDDDVEAESVFEGYDIYRNSGIIRYADGHVEVALKHTEGDTGFAIAHFTEDYEVVLEIPNGKIKDGKILVFVCACVRVCSAEW